MNPMLVGGAMGILVAAIFFLILRSLLAPRTDSVDPEWLADFDPSRYRPVKRLLLEDDYRFLAEQAGYEPSLARRLRTERHQILKAYLRALRRDFDRLHHVAKLLVLYSEQDRPDLAKALFRERARFESSILLVRVRLALPGFPVDGAELARLVRSLEWMRDQIPVVRPMEAMG